MNFYNGSISMSTTFPFYRAKHSQIKLFTHNHHPQYHKQFIVIIITIQHTYYYNHSSPSHWHFSFALLFHFIHPFSVATFENYYGAWRFFFCNQPSATITLIFDPTKFLFGTQHHNAICHITQLLIHYIRKN